MLACTPTFGPWIYNLALVPENMICCHPDVTSKPKPEQLELYRSIPMSGAPNGRAACVLFGVVAAESQLLHAQTVQIPEAKMSKTVNVLPLGAQFSRWYSLLFKIFALDVLQLTVYRHGLTIRTRMVNGTDNGTCRHICEVAYAHDEFSYHWKRNRVQYQKSLRPFGNAPVPLQAPTHSERSG